MDVVTKGQMSGLNQQKFIVSQLWKLEVWYQGVGRAMFPLKPVGEFFLVYS